MSANSSPWAALLPPQDPGPTTTQPGCETPAEDHTAAPGPIPGPVPLHRADLITGWRDRGGEFVRFTPF